MIEFRDFRIESPDGTVLAPLTLSLDPRQITVLLGPSGCGKSTILKALAGIIPPALRMGGDILWQGRPLPARRPFAWAPQSDCLLPWANLIDNAALSLELAGVPRAAARARVRALLPDFGLAKAGHLFPDEVSGGMRQRTAFLRSFLQDCPWALLDEPFSALDAITRMDLQSWLLAELTRAPRGVLLVTHDLHEATLLGERILVMGRHPGRMIADLPNPLPLGAGRTELALAPLRERIKELLRMEMTL